MNDKSEHIFDLNIARKLHSIDASRWLGHGQRAFWLEWNHSYETPRSLATLVHDVENVKWPQFIKPGSTVIDIGAHSGDTAIPMALFGYDKLNGRRSRVVVVEPNPDLEQLLRICLDINSHIADFSFSRCAVTAHDVDAVELSDHANANCNGGIVAGYSEHLANQIKGAAQTTYKARGLSIASLLIEHDVTPSDVAFVKIDCEGYDKEIIRGAKEFFASVKPALYIEWFAWFSPADDDDLFRAIDEIGYQAFHPETLEPLDKSSPRVHDLTCLPKK